MGVLRERLARGDFVCVLDIMPPRGTRSDLLLHRAAVIDGRAHAIGLITRLGHETGLDAALELAGTGSDTVWHLPCAGRGPAEVEADLVRARELDLDQLLVVRGVAVEERTGPAVDPVSALALAREHLPGGLLGLALDQYGDGPKLVGAAQKAEIRPDFVQTYPVFDTRLLEPLAASIRAAWPTTRILASAVAVLEESHVRWLADRLGLEDDALGPYAAARELSSAARWEEFEARVAACVDSPLIDGVAVSTPSPDLTGSQARALRRAVGSALAGNGRG